MNCKDCGGKMIGDGIAEALMCENVDRSSFTREPDAKPLTCTEAKYENNVCGSCFYMVGCLDDNYSIMEGTCPLGFKLSDLSLKDLSEKVKE